jgi:hypothetical protein
MSLVYQKTPEGVSHTDMGTPTQGLIQHHDADRAIPAVLRSLGLLLVQISPSQERSNGEVDKEEEEETAIRGLPCRAGDLEEEEDISKDLERASGYLSLQYLSIYS